MKLIQEIPKDHLILNLNEVAAHDFIKIPLVEAFITITNFDIVYRSETILASTIRNDDEIIQINRYSLLRVDYPNYIKRGCVCIFFNYSEEMI